MAWFELDPDPTHEAISKEHFTAGEENILHEDWRHEDIVREQMNKAGVASHDEYVRRRMAEAAIGRDIESSAAA